VPVLPENIPTSAAFRIGFDDLPSDSGEFVAGDTYSRRYDWLRCVDPATDPPTEEPVDFSGWTFTADVVGATGAVLFAGTCTPTAGDATGGTTVTLDGPDTIEHPGQFVWRLRIGQGIQVSNVLIAGATDGTFSITINGVAFVFVASSSTTAAIAAALLAAINLDPAAVPVTASAGAGDSIDLTADVVGEPFTLAVAHSTAPADIVESLTTAALRRTLICAAYRAAACQ